jgi:Zn-dependent peptidase ImmA (M78 family)
MDQLVQRLGGVVSKQSISKYERGLMKPLDSGLLVRLSKALNVPVDYFLRDSSLSLEGVQFRRKAGLGSKEISSMIEQARDQLERRFELEALLGIDPRFVNPLQGHRIGSIEDVEAAAEKLRRDWGIGVMSPITRVFDLLEVNGIRILELEVTGTLDGLSGLVRGVPVVLLKRDVPGEGRRFTVLRELGHLLLEFGSNLGQKNMEKYCGAFAGAMLLPARALNNELGGHTRSRVSLPELVHLKEHYGISIQAAMTRINSLGMVSHYARRRFDILVNVKKLREQEPGEYPIDEKSTRFMKLLYRALAEGAISLSKAAVLSRIPIDKLQREAANGG